VIVLRCIEVLFVGLVAVVVVLSVLDVEVADPAQLTVHITVFGNFRVLGNTSALDFVLVVGVHVFLLGELSDSCALCQLEVLVEVDLPKNQLQFFTYFVVDMVFIIEGRW